MNITRFTLGLFIIGTFFSCRHRIDSLDLNQVEDASNTYQGTGVSCSPDTSYFVNNVLPIIQSNCAYSGCHGGGSAQDGVNLSNYNSIISTGEVVAFNPSASEIYDVITETDPDKVMPPPPSNRLTQEQITTIYTWINQGAKNNGCDGGCDTLNPTFSSAISPLIQNKCQGCHSGGNPSGGVALTNHTQIATKANDGSLFGTINHEQGYVPMPYGQSKLSQCEIDMIQIWINNGALND